MPETRIETNSVVTIHYVLRDEEGRELYATPNDEPLTYLHGHHQVLPGVERSLEGRGQGDRLELVLEPSDAFGERETEKVVDVPRASFVEEPSVGALVEARLPSGRSQHFLIAALSDDSVTLDGNHPLAGQKVRFDVTVEGVREASPEELAELENRGPSEAH